VNLVNIEVIRREEDRVMVLLKSGEELEGSIPSNVNLAVRTTTFGVPAAFQSEFSDIEVVAFQ
jgi:hypothetical protein